MSLHPRFWIAFIFVGIAAGTVFAGDWPQWRGPARNGISPETGLLDVWPPEGPTIVWKAEVGIGFSSFSVADGRVYTIGNANDTDTVFCLDADKGKVLWYHPYPAELGDKFFEGGPTSTPVVDGDRVYVISRWGDLFCFNAATGKIQWSTNIAKESGAPIPGWGFGGSPFIQGDLLFLNIGEAGLALNKSTGTIVWKSAPVESAYSTPLPLPGDSGLLLFSNGKSFVAADAKTGKEAWRVKWVTNYGVNAADPILQDGLMLLSSGYGKGAGLFRIGKGDPELVWQSRVLATQMNAGVLLAGAVYGIHGDGDTSAVAKQKSDLKCIDFATGEARWAFPLKNAGALTAADGKLFVLSGDGELLIGPAAPDAFKPSARTNILTGKCWTAPVISKGRLYCRNAEGQVVCVDVRKP